MESCRPLRVSFTTDDDDEKLIMSYLLILSFSILFIFFLPSKQVNKHDNL